MSWGWIWVKSLMVLVWTWTNRLTSPMLLARKRTRTYLFPQPRTNPCLFVLFCFSQTWPAVNLTYLHMCLLKLQHVWKKGWVTLSASGQTDKSLHYSRQDWHVCRKSSVCVGPITSDSKGYLIQLVFLRNLSIANRSWHRVQRLNRPGEEWGDFIKLHRGYKTLDSTKLSSVTSLDYRRVTIPILPTEKGSNQLGGQSQEHPRINLRF